jgi:hypothetical protein
LESQIEGKCSCIKIRERQIKSVLERSRIALIIIFSLSKHHHHHQNLDTSEFQNIDDDDDDDDDDENIDDDDESEPGCRSGRLLQNLTLSCSSVEHLKSIFSRRMHISSSYLAV